MAQASNVCSHERIYSITWLLNSGVYRVRVHLLLLDRLHGVKNLAMLMARDILSQQSLGGG